MSEGFFNSRSLLGRRGYRALIGKRVTITANEGEQNMSRPIPEPARCATEGCTAAAIEDGMFCNPCYVFHYSSEPVNRIKAAATEEPQQAIETPDHPNAIPQPKDGGEWLAGSSAYRKGIPIVTGFLDYFPLACAAVAEVSKAGNDKHNPGQRLHWSRGKSSDHIDCAVRHIIDRGRTDSDDGQGHLRHAAWRIMAALQVEEEDRLRKEGRL